MQTDGNASASLSGPALPNVRRATAPPRADILRVRSLLSLLLVWVLVCQTMARPQMTQVQAAPKSDPTNSRGLQNNDGWLARVVRAFAPANAPLAAPVDPSPDTLTDAVISRQHPNLNGGRVEGTLRVLSGQSFSVSNNSQLTSDLYLVGTPAIQLNGDAQHAGVVDTGGSATPANYTITLANNVNMPGRIMTHADAVVLPTDFPASIPAATGTRSVSVNSQSAVAAIGEWQTVRDLSVNGNGLTINVPPGNYGTFTVNGNSRLNFTAGTYNFANTFNLDGSASIQATGLVVINVGQNLTITSGALVLGSYTSPGNVRLNVLGTALNINGSSQVSGLVRAYNATATINGTAQVRGQVIANTVTINGGKVIGAVWPAQTGSSMSTFGPRRFDRTTGSPNQYLEQFSLPPGVTSPYTLHIQNGSLDGTNRVSSATIKLNGVEILAPNDLNQTVASLDRTVTLNATNTLEVKLASVPGSYLIINIGGALPPGDTIAPNITITSPANNATTTDSQTTVTGTASDTGTNASGVAHVYVNGQEATYNSSDSTWTIANVPLSLGANLINAEVVDGAGNQSTASITVTRETPNAQPSVNAGSDQTFALPQTAALHGTASDDGLPQGSSLTTTWTMVSGPGTVTFANPNALDTNASFSSPGTYVLRLTADDSILTNSEDVTITVEPQNQPPTVVAGPDQTIALPHAATLNGSATDDGLPAASVLVTAWTQVSGPGTATFAEAYLTDTTATFSEPGTYVLRLSASDSDLSSESELTITVHPENHAPTVSAGPDEIIALPASAALNGSAADDGWPSGSTLTQTWTVVSGPAAVNIVNPDVTVTSATFSQAGAYVLRLTASDGELSSFDDVTITVDPQNQAPVVDVGPDQTITLPNELSLNASVTDDGWPRNSTVTVSWGQLIGPGIATFSSGDAAITHVSFSQAGVYTLRLTATDGFLTGADEFSVTVIPENHGPTANAGADQTIALPGTASLNGSAADDGLPGGSTLTTTWSKLSGPGTVTFANPNVTITTAAFSEAGTYTLRLTATDSELTASDDVVVEVDPENQPPTVNAGADQTITLPAQASLNGSVTDDGWPRNSSVSVSWTQVSGPGTASFGTPGAATTSVSFSEAGTYVLRLTASDSQLTANDEITVTVIPENHAPTVNAGGDQTITLPNVASLNGSASDDGLPAGSTLTTTWSKLSGPGTVTFANPNVTVTTAAFSEAGTYQLRLTASDLQLTVSAEITVTVIPQNFPPTANAGADQTIELPNTASLNGSASDDGLPAGSTLTTSWSKVSGPGAVAFANSNATITTAAFSEVGIYILRLTATDSDLSDSDEVQVTVLPQNYPPIVNAGADQTVTMPEAVTLNGTVSDDGLPAGGSLNSSWSKVSGPGEVVFSSPSTTTTSATFCAAGTYVLRLTATDSQLSGSDELTVTVRKLQTQTFQSGNGEIGQQDAYNVASRDGGLTYHPAYVIETYQSWLIVPGTNFYWENIPGTKWINWQNNYWAAQPGNWFTSLSVTKYRLTFTLPADYSNPALFGRIAADERATVRLNGTQIGQFYTAHSPFGFLSTDDATLFHAGENLVEFDVEDICCGTHGFDYRITISATTAAPLGNQAPAVKTGPSQTISLPNSASLNGTVADDGLPCNTPLTVLWSKVSGPGSVTFANPNARETTASFITPGSYILRLSANDGELASSDDIGVIVDPPNQAPVVNAGADQVVRHPDGVSLNGSVTDDGVPTGSTVSATWSKQSGPGEVIFANSHAAATTATFTVAGVYILRLAASDSDLTAFDELTVTVNPLTTACANDDFTEDFDDNSLNAGKWTIAAPGTTVAVFERNQRLELVLQPNKIDYNGIHSLSTFDLRGKSLQVEVKEATSQVGYTETYLVAALDGSNYYLMDAGAGSFALDSYTAGVRDRTVINYQATTHRFWRLRHASDVNKVYFETSADGSIWTIRKTVPATFPLNAIRIQLMAGAWGTGNGAPGKAVFDNVRLVGLYPNCLPSVTLTSPAPNAQFETHSNISLEASASDSDGSVSKVEFYSNGAKLGEDVASPYSFVWNDVAAGTHSLTARVIDDRGASATSAPVQITVFTPNQAPIVNAGPDQSITLPAVATLNGSASDDGLPAGSTLTTTWSKVSGPGTVTFANQNATVTTAAFSAAGTYVLRLTASDSALSPSDDVQITVNANQAPVAADDSYIINNDVKLPPGFSASTFLSGSPFSSIAGITTSPDGKLYVSDSGKIIEVTISTKSTLTITTLPFARPHTMLIGNGSPQVGTDLIVADHNSEPNSNCCNGQVLRINRTTGATTILSAGNPTFPPFGDPYGLALSPDGSFGTGLFVMDFEGSSPNPPVLFTVNSDGTRSTFLVNSNIWTTSRAPLNLAFGRGGGFGGDLFVADTLTATPPIIWRVTAQKDIRTFMSGEPLKGPGDLRFGPGGLFGTDLYILDNVQKSILRVSADGTISTFARNLPLNNGEVGSMDFAPDGNSLFVAANTKIIRIGAPSLSIPAPGVLSNDHDNELSPLTAPLTQNPSFGTVTLNSNGSFDYTAGNNFAGTDSFTYQASDGQLSSNNATVSITNIVNQTPVINAGPDQIINLPASAILNGAATDDGLPVGSALATSWSKVSGPGSVTFAQPNSAATSASFSQVGTYTLRLTASDGQLSVSDDIAVKVDPPNLAPTVNAGPDQSITLPATASLNGTVSDDGQPAGSIVTTTWSQVSGPGTVAFGNPAVTVTTASFSIAGTYVLRLTGTDSVLTTSDDITIIVAPDPRIPPVADFVVPESSGAAGSFVLAQTGSGAANLLDDSTGTAWTTSGVTNQSATMQFYDQESVFIDRVRLQALNAIAGTTCVRDFDVRVSSTTSADASFVTVLSATLLNNGQLQEFIIPGGPARARYIRLVPKNNYGSASSIQIATFNAVAAGSADSIISLPGSPNVSLAQSPSLLANGGAIYTSTYAGGELNITGLNPHGLLGYNNGGWNPSLAANPYAVIQLGGGNLHTLKGVKVASMSGVFSITIQSAVRDFEVWVSSTTPDDASFTKVLTANKAIDTTLETFLFPGGPVQARYVKYVPLTNGGNPNVNTQIFDVIAEDVATVVGSTAQNESNPTPPDAAFDADPNSSWFSPSGATTNVWVKTSLANGATHKTYGVRISPVSSTGAARGPKDFDIRVSTTTADDSAFTTVYSGTLAGTVNGAAQEFLFPNPVDAKYVQFFWKNGYSPTLNIGVSSLEVLSIPTRGSSIVAFSTQEDPATNALDLDPSNQWVTALNNPTNQWLKLLLPGAAIQTIRHIALRPAIATNGNYSAPKDFELQVSTTDSADASFTTVLAATLVNSTQFQDFYFPPAQARYVRLLLKNNYGNGRFGLANFYVYSPDQIGSTTRFIDRSADADGQLVSWAWNFGDGGTSTEQHPTHTFPAPGDYTVSLTVTDNYRSDAFPTVCLSRNGILARRFRLFADIRARERRAGALHRYSGPLTQGSTRRRLCLWRRHHFGAGQQPQFPSIQR